MSERYAYGVLYSKCSLYGVLFSLPLSGMMVAPVAATHAAPEAPVTVSVTDEAPPAVVGASEVVGEAQPNLLEIAENELPKEEAALPRTTGATEVLSLSPDPSALHAVPFYSQFADITEPSWQKVGCGIAGVAMLIDFYTDAEMDVDALLQQGIEAGSFLADAGWTHAGLINLTRQFGLNGESRSLAHLSMDDAFTELKAVVSEGPVMVSVHYTFDRSNPIPHLAVITGIDDSRVFYNDPADFSGQRSISIAQFQSAWKKRYIAIRPAGA